MIDTEALSCQELVELVTGYLEGALGERDLRAFEGQLADCDGCTEYLEQIRQTIAVVGTLRREDLPPDAERTLMRAFRDWYSTS